MVQNLMCLLLQRDYFIWKINAFFLFFDDQEILDGNWGKIRNSLDNELTSLHLST